ncbi:MAG: hypothetical protein CVV27_09130 [Candidatus Melainabacteria bacterium HGW-Melainabacteria-1]|nr:MAG: hypothetical protein CVV27_09130 [Candidatus Melainabacteria bacterium HGW-Melainabacteria-1]
MVVVPPLMGLFDAGPPAPAPMPSVSEDPDKIAEADGDNAAPMELRGKRDDTGMVIEESDSKVTLTIPARFLEPYPIRYVRQDQAPIQVGPADSAKPLDQLARNTRVQLIGANPAKTWLQIRRFEDAQGKALSKTQDVWIRASLLADDRIRTPEEIDAEIKARFGGNYWAIEAKGNASMLLINAPTAQQAHDGLVTAFSHYASRQLLKLINAHGHQPFDSLEAESAPVQLNGNPASFRLDFKIYGHNAAKARQMVGEKSLTVQRGSDGRYRLREALEGL